MDAPDRSAALRAHAHSAAVTPPTRSGAGRGLTAVWRASSCAACPIGYAAMNGRVLVMNAGELPSTARPCAIDRWYAERGRSGKACSADCRGAKLARRGLAEARLKPVPWRPSGARSAARRGGVSDGRRRARRDGGSMRSTTARPGRETRTLGSNAHVLRCVNAASRLYPKPQIRESGTTPSRKGTERRIRECGFAPIHKCGCTRTWKASKPD